MFFRSFRELICELFRLLVLTCGHPAIRLFPPGHSSTSFYNLTSPTLQRTGPYLNSTSLHRLAVVRLLTRGSSEVLLLQMGRAMFTPSTTSLLFGTMPLLYCTYHRYSLIQPALKEE